MLYIRQELTSKQNGSTRRVAGFSQYREGYRSAAARRAIQHVKL